VSEADPVNHPTLIKTTKVQTIFLEGARTGADLVRMEITGGTVENTNESGTDTQRRAIHSNTGGIIKISGGKVWNSGSNGNRAIHLTFQNTLEVSGGEISAVGGVAIQHDNADNAGSWNLGPGYVYISGGNITSSGNVIVLNGQATLTMTNGYISSTSGSRAISHTSSGTVSISGGTLETTAGISTSRTVDVTGTGTLNISGGTIKIAPNGAAVGIGTNSTLRITGGTIEAGSDSGSRSVVAPKGPNVTNDGGTLIGPTNPLDLFD